MAARRGRSVALAGLGALVAANSVLFALLLRPDAPVEGGPVPGAPEAPTDPVPVGGVGEGAGAAPLPDSIPRAGRVLSAASEQVAYRSGGGDCSAPSVVERTGDGGRTWEPVDLVLSPVVRLAADTEAQLRALGGGQDCGPIALASADAGRTWLPVDGGPTTSWYPVPGAWTDVHGPEGQGPAPCAEALLDVAGRDRAGTVLCSDGVVFASSDGGLTWVEIGWAERALALTVTDSGYALATVDPACEGLLLIPFEQDGSAPVSAEPVCVPVPAAPGAVALSVIGTAAWVWSGDAVAVTRVAGAAW